MSNVLITGSEGFIGQHVVKRFLEAGHEVTGVDRLEARVHKDREGLLPQFKERDYKFVVQDVSYVGFNTVSKTEIVIHLAAQVGVADSMVDPVRYTQGNTVATSRFLQDLKLWSDNLEYIFVASSMSIYGDPLTAKPIPESHSIRIASVYGLTKYDQEKLCRLWGSTNSVPVLAGRFFNVYGPGQALHNPYTGVLANFANWLLAGERPIVYEDGQQTRDFVYIQDIVDAVFALTEQRAVGSLNISTGQATTIYDTAKLLAKGLGKDIEPNVTGEERDGDIHHCIGSCAALRSILPSWNPRSFTNGIREYAEWLLQQQSQ